MSDNQSKGYSGPVNRVQTTKNRLGNRCATTTVKHESIQSCSEITAGTHLPGVIIFVHGVNSEGEWYKQAERYLCEGLNKRLGIEGQEEYKLKPNVYTHDGDEASVPKERILLTTESTYLKESNRSPVIRFYWGYRAKEDELDSYLIPLKNRQGESYHAELDKIKATDSDEYATAKQQVINKGPYFWGGGPFQNGTTSLPPSWNGFSLKGKIWGLYPLQELSPGKDRLLTAAPSRAYYAHASWRLAMLIQRIRDNYPKDTITLVSHSQGTIISMAASLISAPDALFLMNSPYRMTQIAMDLVSYDSPDNITTKAREKTFAKVVEAVGQYHKRLEKDPNLQNLISVGKPCEGEAWSLSKQHKVLSSGDQNEEDMGYIQERDNHGRTYIYCNPHDRVMGASPLVSTGWQGLPNDKSGNPHPLLVKYEGRLFQRMLARETPCGGEPNPQTPFGMLPYMFSEEIVTITKPEFAINARQSMYNYEVEKVNTQQITKKIFKKPFWDDMQYAITVPNPTLEMAIKYPEIAAIFKVLKVSGNEQFIPTWVTPPVTQTISINGERVPESYTPDATFDRKYIDLLNSPDPEGYGQKKGDVPNDWSYRYNQPLYKRYYQVDENRKGLKYCLLDEVPKGFDTSDEAEIVRQKNRAQGHYGIENGWVIKPASPFYNQSISKNIIKSLILPDKFAYFEWSANLAKNELKALEEYISSPSDHSTLPQDKKFLAQVMAYDLPIGLGEAVDPCGHFKEELIRLADWTLPGVDPYMDDSLLACDATIDQLRAYFPEQTLLPTGMPSTIDREYALSAIDLVRRNHAILPIVSVPLVVLHDLDQITEGLKSAAELSAQGQIAQANAQLALANTLSEKLNHWMVSFQDNFMRGMEIMGESEQQNSALLKAQGELVVKNTGIAVDELKTLIGNLSTIVGDSESQRLQQESEQAKAMYEGIKSFFN